MHTSNGNASNGFRPWGLEQLPLAEDEDVEDGVVLFEDGVVLDDWDDEEDLEDDDLEYEAIATLEADWEDSDAWEYLDFEDLDMEDDEFEAYVGTAFPMLRGAIADELAELDDEELAETLATDGFDAEQLEGFMQTLGRIGQAIGGALPAIGTGAATGASVGSIVPGLGTGVGAAVGGILGGLGSILGRLGGSGSRRAPARPRRRPSPAPRPRTVRQGVSRRPTAPRPASPSTPRPRTAGTPSTAVARTGSTPSDFSAQTLLRLLSNPQVIQAITALALGRNGREWIEVAGRPIPTEAFAELVSELAQEASFDEGWSPPSPESYLLAHDGEALVDLNAAGERAGALLGLLAADTWGEDVPGPGPEADEALYSMVEWTEADDGGYADALMDEAEPYPDAESFDIEGGYEAALPTSGSGDLVLLSEDEGDEGEAVPAFIAAGGLIVAASNLGLGVFDRLERHLLSGSFSVTSHASNYIHNPTPRGLTTHTRTFRFPITAHHPRVGIGTQTFWFDLTLEYDGFNIRRVAITEDRGRSSSLVSSSFSVSFQPAAYSAPNEPVAAIVYNISGRWDPIGRGDESFQGSLIVDAQGRMRRLRVRSGRSWVRVGRATRRGGGRVPRPTRAIHATAVHFDRPGRTRLSASDIRHLHGWYTRLPASVKAEIQAGRLPVRLTGRASTTASVQRNQEIARRRAQAVAAALRDVAGSSASFVLRSHGELGARTGDNQEDPSERRVDVRIEYQLYR